MPNPRLLAIVTVAMLAITSPASQAAYSKTDLQTIEQMIISQDWAALSSYIDANPDLLSGNNPLAQELRTFAESYRTGFIAQIFSPPIAPDIEAIDTLVSQY